MQLNVALVKKLGAGFFGGEGFILERLTGPGDGVHPRRRRFRRIRRSSRRKSCRWTPAASWPSTRASSYDIQFAGGIKTAIFGGEGLFLATLTGPGRVIVQSMTLEKLRRELAPGRSGGDERSPIGSISNLFGSDD